MNYSPSQACTLCLPISFPHALLHGPEMHPSFTPAGFCTAAPSARSPASPAHRAAPLRMLTQGIHLPPSFSRPKHLFLLSSHLILHLATSGFLILGTTGMWGTILSCGHCLVPTECLAAALALYPLDASSDDQRVLQTFPMISGRQYHPLKATELYDRVLLDQKHWRIIPSSF